MKTKKIPMRRCVVTKESLEKKDLIRVVRTPEKEIKVDLTGKANGRGAYLKKDLRVLDKCEKQRILEQVLQVEEIPKEIFEEIKSIIEKN